MKKIYLLLSFILLLTIKSDAQSWLAVGPGTALGNTTTGVRAIAVSPYDGAIYAGGTFTGSVNYLAKYNPGSDSWQSVGVGVSGPVYALKFFKGKLYVGGSFATAGGLGANNIVAIDAAGTYSTVGVGLNGQVNCFEAAPDSAYLYVGGQFSADFSNTTTLLHVAKTDLVNWTAVGNGITPVVNCLTMHNSTLYAGTNVFTNALYTLSGSTWTSFGSVTNGNVYAIASHSGNLYIGGDFQQPYFAAARYDGSWHSVGTTLTGFLIRSMQKIGNYLFIGGSFTNVGVGGAYYIARIDNPLQPFKAVIVTNNPGAAPYAIASKDGYVYLGGSFPLSIGGNVLKSSITIGVDEINELIETSSFFPNPLSTSSTLNVKLKNHANSAQLSIIDAQGKIVQEQMISELSNNEINFTIDRNALATGIYHYQLTIDGQSAAANSFVIE
jgi:hypothetical protein